MEDVPASGWVGAAGTPPQATEVPRAEPAPRLSRLLPVALTRVWPTEPRDFTPWLLDNAALLGEALGIDLELEAREHRVGRYYLDLLGRDVETGHPVIVENQYGTTDHNHLGQLLTYAGGTDPTTVVWIAERFSDEHRAALGWLNRRTTTDVRFFGVEVRAITLEGADHLVAPMFDVVVEPNDWERKALAAAQGGVAPSPRQELYREFWTVFEEEAKARRWTNGRAPGSNWWDLPSGSRGATWSVSFTNFGARSELNFSQLQPEVSVARLRALATRQTELEVAFGGPLHFDELEGKRSCRMEARVDGPKIDNRDEWPVYLAWFIDSQMRLRAAVETVGGIPSETSALESVEWPPAEELGEELRP